MKSNPLVSVIITTKNEEKNIEACLRSIKSQSYKHIQMIVVDNRSTDMTVQIAKKYTTQVFQKGPERSAQRNYGAQKAEGSYLLFIDADMILSEVVISDCVSLIKSKQGIGGIIIPEESIGEGFWAQCKKLERSFYRDNDFIEAARFYDHKKFNTLRGFDTSLTGPEDWDLSQKIREAYGLSRIQSLIYHNEGRLSLFETVRKKYYYSKKFSTYIQKNENTKYSNTQFNILKRYSLFFSKPAQLFKNPITGIGMLFMKTAEFTAGSFGYLSGLFNKE